jgi:hypothetical protein
VTVEKVALELSLFSSPELSHSESLGLGLDLGPSDPELEVSLPYPTHHGAWRPSLSGELILGGGVARRPGHSS